MKTVNYPTAQPVDILNEFKRAARDARVSTAAAIRRSAKVGLPKFREEAAGGRVTNVDPLPDDMARKLYADREDDAAAIRRLIAAQPKDARRGPGKAGRARSSDPIRSC